MAEEERNCRLCMWFRGYADGPGYCDLNRGYVSEDASCIAFELPYYPDEQNLPKRKYR